MEHGCIQCTCLHPFGVGCCETSVIHFLLKEINTKSSIVTAIYFHRNNIWSAFEFSTLFHPQCAAASGLPPLVPGASWICNLQGELGADLWPTSALHSGRREQRGPRSWRNERETSRLTRQQSSWSICQTCTMPVCLSCHCASPVGSVIMIQ